MTSDWRVTTKNSSSSKIAAAETALQVEEDHLTSPGSALGTVAYMSPEQARAKQLDARTDLFSFGAVLYEMATGQMPFHGESTAVVFDAILNRSPVAAVRLNSDVPPDLERIINRALEKDRELRYQHASDMRAELQRLKRDMETGRVAAAGSETTMAHDGISSVAEQMPQRPGSSPALVSSGAERPVIVSPLPKAVPGGRLPLKWIVVGIVVAAMAAGIYLVIRRSGGTPGTRAQSDNQRRRCQRRWHGLQTVGWDCSEPRPIR